MSFHFTCEAWPDKNRLWHYKKSYFLLKIGWILKNQEGKICVRVSHIHSFCINSSWFITGYSFLCFCTLKFWKPLRKIRWRQFFPMNVFWKVPLERGPCSSKEHFLPSFKQSFFTDRIFCPEATNSRNHFMGGKIYFLRLTLGDGVFEWSS